MIVDVKHIINIEEAIKILSYATSSDIDKVKKIYEEYLFSNNFILLGYEIDNKLVGLIGFYSSDKVSKIYELKHISVDIDYRKSGIGRKLIENILEAYDIKELVAETDDDAVDFYKKMGFEIVNLGEKYPGTIRYRCSLRM